MADRLLFISHRVPWPRDHGGAIRTFELLQGFVQRFDVDLFAVDPRPNAEARSALDALTDHLGLQRSSLSRRADAHSAVSTAIVHGRALLRGQPYVYSGNASKAIRRDLTSFVGNRGYRFAHADALDVFPLLDDVLKARPGLIAVLGHHNVESRLTAHRAKASRSALVRRYLARQSRLLREQESYAVARVSLNVVVSDDDSVALQAINPEARTLTIENGTSIPNELGRPASVGRDVVFLGPSEWWPNLDGMEFFRDEIAPLLDSDGKAPTVEWIGKVPDSVRTQFPHVRFRGFVEDLHAELASYRCMIVPLRRGGGTRLKILDGWAAEVPVVSTSIGSEGLRIEHDVNGLVADTPARFAESVRELLDAPTKAREMGLSGRRTVEQHYAWTGLVERLNTELVALATGI